MSRFIGNVSAYAYAVSKGYTGTEEEFAELMASYAEVGQTAVDAAESASASATASAQSASQASASEQGCERAVLDATSAAAIARARADEASGYAQTASTKASEAVGCVETATQKATESAQSASQALGYKNDAESAKNASQTAQGLAESARDSAISAKNDAESARDEAQEIVDGISAKAEQIDTNTADIAELESTKVDFGELYKAFPTDTASGAVASFTDGADDLPLKSLVVDIEPVQDLHGYNSPWPAGGGKNLIYKTLKRVNIDADGKIISYNAFDVFCAKVESGKTYTLSINGVATRSVDVGYFAEDPVLGSTTYDGNRIINLQATFEATYTGFIGFRFDTDTANVQLEEGSTATAYAPYENVCPISGWTEVDVEQSGVNVWDEEWEVGGINGTGDPISATNRIRSKNFSAISPNTTYYATCGKTDGGNQNIYYLAVFFYDSTETFISYAWANNLTFTTPSNAAYFKIATNSSIVVYGDTYNHDISINYPSTDHSYHPYTGRSITINLGQTVYGAKLYPLEGKAVIDRAMVDLGAKDWVYRTDDAIVNVPYFNVNLLDRKPGSINFICSCYANTGGTRPSLVDKSCATYNSSNSTSICIADSAYTDATAFKAAVTGQTLVYELATPITVALTPNELSTLLGANNIWSDAGEVTAEYRADPTLYIQRLTEPDVDMVADSNITSGSYFMVGNTLYKATANIASGATISPNVNCTRKSLSEALNELNS